MLYKTERMKDKQFDGDDSESSSDGDVNEDELADKASEVEDAILKENAEKLSGRIIRDEQDEIITVSLASYKKYLDYAGGWWIVMLLNFVLLCFIFASMAANYLMQKWAYADAQTQIDDFNFYVISISALTLLTALLIFTRTNTQVFAGLRVGKRLHNELISYVFRAPINLFFDVTPIGKILNRFSKDLAVIDEQIYYNFGGFLVCLWQTIACLIVSATAVPMILTVIAVFLVAVFCLFVYSMKAYKDCYRIESVTMSPILSYMQETFNGSSVIRAFGRSEEFRKHSYALVNKTTCAN